jgi:hypothetical protein
MQTSSTRLTLQRAFTVGVLAAVASVALLAWPQAAMARKTLGLSTGSFEFSVAAGQGGKGDVTVMNDGTEPIKVLVYTANQTVDSKGVVTYTTPSINDPASMETPATWLRVQMPASSKSVGNTPYLEMTPGQKVPVRFNFTTPANVAPGDHQILLFFEMFEFRKGANGAVSKVSGRLGSRIRIRVQGDLIERLDVRPFVIPSYVMRPVIPFVFTVRNGGNIDKTVSSTVTILDRNENERFSSSVMSDTTIFAGTDVERSGTLLPRGLTFGRFTVRLTTNYPREGSPGGAQLPQQIVKDRSIWIVPLWFLVIIGFILLALVLWAAWRLAVRSAVRRVERARARNMDNADRGRGGMPRREESGGGAASAQDASHASEYWSEDESPGINLRPGQGREPGES